MHSGHHNCQAFKDHGVVSSNFNTSKEHVVGRSAMCCDKDCESKI